MANAIIQTSHDDVMTNADDMSVKDYITFTSELMSCYGKTTDVNEVESLWYRMFDVIPAYDALDYLVDALRLNGFDVEY